MSVVMAMALSLDMVRAMTESQFVIHLLPIEREPADQGVSWPGRWFRASVGCVGWR